MNSDSQDSMRTGEEYRLLSTFGSRKWMVAGIVLILGVSIPVWRATTSRANAPSPALHAPAVAVARVEREDLAAELTCDSELRPYQEVDLHAKVAGYLQNIRVDIGDQVKAGDLIATIEVPELADDIKRAQAAERRSEQEVARAQAGYDQAHLVYTRLTSIGKSQPNLIAQQELDAGLEKDRASASALAAAQAEVEVARAELDKLQTMQKYSKISAPFAGVITERYVDPGALIQAGISSSTQTLPLVRLSQNDRLRLDIPVSVSYVAHIALGDPVEIQVASVEKPLTGVIARTTRKVDTATRTMKVEVDVPNPDLKLIPGMYASAALRIEHRNRALAVPVEAVSRGKNSTVFVVNKENKIEERTVNLGMETPQKLEVLNGLTENEMVMVGSRTQIKPGELVEPKLVVESGSLAH